MPVFLRLIKALQASTIKVSWTFLFLMVVCHSALSWAFMALSNEAVANTLGTWVYFYVTTATTVGYGDYSPVTPGGQWAAALWVIPGGIILFASLIGKATANISSTWRMLVQGNANYSSLCGHTLVIGWHGEPTAQIIRILQADPNLPDDIVLCVTKDIDNPLPGSIKFVKGDSFSNPELLARAGIQGANRVIIYDEADERVATIALSVFDQKPPNCHVVAHCDNPATANMLRRTLPGIECTQGLSIEMLVRSATDAGISRVVNELLAIDHGATQFQGCLPDTLPADQKVCYGELMNLAKSRDNVTLLGVWRPSTQTQQLLNPPADFMVGKGDTLYYMGNKRLTEEELTTLFMSAVQGAS
ncbi:potassium channel family protein [Vreelandella nigrificans]|uniref:Calcium-gated potassium channel protein n=1 Tax=Vreelandella nigrificans TaxID=2042704 RepID=A0A2A4HNY6_9GAMM|nr:potassium channel family protein [Halomonas nigrificans]PCF95935.1 calcium-gated potassium channel protein [Halomonas nigrificans]